MQDFVFNVLWPELEKRKDMLWTSATDVSGNKQESKCILDRLIYSRGRQLRMPGCCKFGGAGLPRASLPELHRMRTSFYRPDLPVGTCVITSAMVAKICARASGVKTSGRKRKKEKTKEDNDTDNRKNKRPRVTGVSLTTNNGKGQGTVL
jgi:hypothetical protein